MFLRIRKTQGPSTRKTRARAQGPRIASIVSLSILLLELLKVLAFSSSVGALMRAGAK